MANNFCAQGFFGEVYAASLKKWAGLQEEMVAVKCMRKTSLLESFQTESGLRDLQREIEIMKSLRHPNIVEIKGLVEGMCNALPRYVEHVLGQDSVTILCQCDSFSCFISSQSGILPALSKESAGHEQ